MNFIFFSLVRAADEISHAVYGCSFTIKFFLPGALRYERAWYLV